MRSDVVLMFAPSTSLLDPDVWCLRPRGLGLVENEVHEEVMGVVKVCF